MISPTLAIRFRWRRYAPLDPLNLPIRFGGGPTEPPRIKLHGGLSAPWDAGNLTRLSLPLRAPLGTLAPAGGTLAAPWPAAHRLARPLRAPWPATRRFALPLRAPWGVSRRMAVPLLNPWGEGIRAVGALFALLGLGDRLHGLGVPLPVYFPPPPVRGENRCGGPLDPLTLKLTLRNPNSGGSLKLVFICRPVARRVLPVRRTYYMRNSAYLVRARDGLPLPSDAFTLALDADSYTWSFTASVTDEAFAAVLPGTTKERVLATVNGNTIAVRIEQARSERRFGKTIRNISGRGIAAELDFPEAPSLRYHNDGTALDSQQLADSSVPFDWTIDWEIDPWLVTAGAWSHQGSSITALKAIATAGGAYVQPRSNAQILRVMPWLPYPPEDWGTIIPDVQIPAAGTEVEGIEWVETPEYNRVVITGEVGGVIVEATKDGTDGLLEAETVTDPLNTSVIAGRQRAMPILYGGGKTAIVTLRLQVRDEIGLLLPGMFVRYLDGPTQRVGLVRGVSIDVSQPVVRQSVRILTYV